MILLLSALGFAVLFAALTPIAGKLGRVTTVISATTVQHEFEDWQMELRSNMIPVNGFEKTADADSAYWENYLSGLNTGRVNLSGWFNTAKLINASFKAGKSDYTSLFCGMSTMVGFTLTGKCESINASQNVAQAGRCGVVWLVEGVTTYAS